MEEFKDLGKYDPSAIEQKWYKFWEDHDVFMMNLNRVKNPTVLFFRLQMLPASCIWGMH